MKYLLFWIAATCFATNIYAQEPSNNIGKSLSTMKREFPELRYLRTDEKGDFYEDGYPEEGIAMFFYFKNGQVVEECMTVESEDGFAQMWYDSMVKTFNENRSYVFCINKPNQQHWCFSYFQIHLLIDNQEGKRLAMIIYQKGGYQTGITRNSFYDEWK